MKKIEYFFLVVAYLSLFAVSASANPDKVCEDLYRLTCAPGTYDDGTGSATNPGYFANNAQEVTKKLYEQTSGKFSAILKDPKNKYFRKAVLSGTGLALHPDCKDAETNPSTSCLQLMSQGLAEILAKSHNGMGGFGTMAANGSIRDVAYITDSPLFQRVQEEYIATLRKELNQSGIEKKVKEVVYPKVKALLLAKIDSLIKDPTTKANLRDKVEAIEFVGSDCSKDFGNDATVSGLLISNAFYNPIKNTFKYCMGMALNNDSEFQLAFIIAHELAHSVDPCGITKGPSDYAFKYKSNVLADSEKEYPFSGIPACLRDPKSASARNLVPQNSNYTIPAYGTPAAPIHPFCEDQTTESFSDWIAAEITPEYIQDRFPKLSTEQKRFGYSNIWRGLCQDNTSGMHSAGVHPPTDIRANKIILAQPKIRQQMNCPEKSDSVRYCSIGADNTPVSPSGDPAKNPSEPNVSTAPKGAQ